MLPAHDPVFYPGSILDMSCTPPYVYREDESVAIGLGAPPEAFDQCTKSPDIFLRATRCLHGISSVLSGIDMLRSSTDAYGASSAVSRLIDGDGISKLRGLVFWDD